MLLRKLPIELPTRFIGRPYTARLIRIDGTAVQPLTLRPGEFAILYPNTCAHAPCCSEDAAGTPIRKIVIKVRK